MEHHRGEQFQAVGNTKKDFFIIFSDDVEMIPIPVQISRHLLHRSKTMTNPALHLHLCPRPLNSNYLITTPTTYTKHLHIPSSKFPITRVSSPSNHFAKRICFNYQRPNGVVLATRNSSSYSNSNSNSNDDGKKDEDTKLLTLPTVLTLARVIAVLPFIATFYVSSLWGTTATTTIFVAASITDWLDGYLARKMHLGTAFGAFLDPVADKLMVAAALVLLCTRPPETALLGDVPWLFPVPAIAIIGREITMSAVREWAASQNTELLQAVAVNNLGKWKTATQMTALTFLVASRDTSLAGSGVLAASGVGLLYISAGLGLWSLGVYMRNIWKVLLR